MPSDKMGGRGRMAIVTWRVKAGSKDIFSGTRGDCEEFIRKTPKVDGKKCRLIRPNS
jgi:hypothetical protein